MVKVYLICGKICSGKSWYARRLKKQLNAVILSTDEMTYDLIRNEQGSFYDMLSVKANLYLRKKAAEIARVGTNVILDWGFWTREDRKEISDYLMELGVEYEWHYIDIDDALWQKNIEQRNRRVLAGQGGSDFFVNEGLLKKVIERFETPEKAEMDVWHDASERYEGRKDNMEFEFRTIHRNEAEETIRIEAICFPPNEACKREHMVPRIEAASDVFWVAVDKETGHVAGFINGIATNETSFRDEFFTDASLHDPQGENLMICGLDVLPEYRNHGLARELVQSYAERETNRRKRLVLTCLENLVPMYQKFGFYDLGISASQWGGEEWHEMEMKLGD